MRDNYGKVTNLESKGKCRKVAPEIRPATAKAPLRRPGASSWSLTKLRDRRLELHTLINSLAQDFKAKRGIPARSSRHIAGSARQESGDPATRSRC